MAYTYTWSLLEALHFRGKYRQVLELWGEAIYRGRLRAWGGLHAAFTWIEGRAGCGNVKRCREQRSWQGHGQAHGLHSKNETTCLARAETARGSRAAGLMWTPRALTSPAKS